ncbi:MAG: sigma-54 factor interaction domain-containing protein, partial [Terrimicrobiaceae bacterium]
MENNEPNVGSSDQIGAEMAVRRWRIILWDQQAHRRARIRKLVDALGARAIEMLDLQRTLFSSACCVAAVGTGSEPNGEGMLAIRELKSQGFEIVAYGDGSEHWSVKRKCFSLLAGAGQLLDSGNAHFDARFQDALTQILKVEAKKQEEDQEITSAMRSMGMVGSSMAMADVFRSIIRFSTLSDLPVLIVGETGTGKEGLARALHRLDPKRREGPFVAVNCGAIAAPLAESEFFGHRRGAFTGADRDRKGLIRSAEGGVLFLDEIGELDAALQAKLLRVLQESRVLGVGEDRDIQVNVRVVAATNRDLDQMGQQSRFRADLFHRLNVLSIRVPPLSERADDLAPLTQHFL